MRLASSGKINTLNILTATSLLNGEFAPANLPICVDFDHVFDLTNPSRCFARSNIDNPTENLFYITRSSQPVLNQVEAGIILPGKYFAILPCKSTAIEDTVNYGNNLVVTAFIVSDKDCTEELTETIKSIYDRMGVAYNVLTNPDKPRYAEFMVHGVIVCGVETFVVGDNYVSVANVISEPIFSQAVAMTI